MTAVEAWRVHDTGLVAAPGRFRRLGGLVRHHRGDGPDWPRAVTLDIVGGDLRVSAGDGSVLGTWAASDVQARLHATGPPVQFVLEVPGTSQLVAAAADDATWALLAALGASR